MMVFLLAMAVAKNTLPKDYSQVKDAYFNETIVDISHYIVMQQPVAPYQFAYVVDDTISYNKFGHRESSDGRAVIGSYRVGLPDGCDSNSVPEIRIKKK